MSAEWDGFDEERFSKTVEEAAEKIKQEKEAANGKAEQDKQTGAATS